MPCSHGWGEWGGVTWVLGGVTWVLWGACCERYGVNTQMVVYMCVIYTMCGVCAGLHVHNQPPSRTPPINHHHTTRTP